MPVKAATFVWKPGKCPSMQLPYNYWHESTQWQLPDPVPECLQQHQAHIYAPLLFTLMFFQKTPLYGQHLKGDICSFRKPHFTANILRVKVLFIITVMKLVMHWFLSERCSSRCRGSTEARQLKTKNTPKTSTAAFSHTYICTCICTTRPPPPPLLIPTPLLSSPFSSVWCDNTWDLPEGHAEWLAGLGRKSLSCVTMSLKLSSQLLLF